MQRVKQQIKTDEPRCMNLKSAARYSGISYHSLRLMALNGVLPLVELPGLTGKGQLRRLLIEKADLDELINRSKRKGMR